MKNIQKTVIGLAAAALITGCASSGNNKSAFLEYQEKRPVAEFVTTENPKVDEVGKNMAELYGTTTSLLDGYIAATEGHRSYVAFLNDTQGMSSEQSLEYYNSLSNDIQKEISAALELEGVNGLSNAAELLIKARELQKATADCSSAFTGFDIAAMKKAKSVKNMGNQASYTIKTLTFLKQQYDTVSRLKTAQGR